MNPVGASCGGLSRWRVAELGSSISCRDADTCLQGGAVGLPTGLQEAACARGDKAFLVCWLPMCCESSLDGVVGGSLDLQNLACRTADSVLFFFRKNRTSNQHTDPTRPSSCVCVL
jgi:hypothetical protein